MVLLLAIAVILPTVCLLWFMSQAVKNERLAVKQKLTDIYHALSKFLCIIIFPHKCSGAGLNIKYQTICTF